MLAIPRTYTPGGWEHNLPATPSTAANGIGTLVTASASTNTKGSYSQIVASTSLDWYGFWIEVGDTSVAATRTDMLLDLAIGAASSEQIIIPDLMVGYRQTIHNNPGMFWMPIYIPRGTRIAARCQAAIASDTCRVLIHGVDGDSGLPGPLFSACDTYGTVAASSKGTGHTPGNTGVESTAANIGSPTTKHYGAVLLTVMPDAGTTVTAIGYHWELMVGSQTVAEWRTRNSTSEDTWGPMPPAPTTVSIPSGTQLQVRAEASGTAQVHTVSLYCFY